MNTVHSKGFLVKRSPFPFILISFFFFFVIGITILAFHFERNHVQSNYIINGLKYSSSRQIDSILELSLKHHKSKLDIIKMVESLSYIETCKIFSLNSETVVIDTKERVPIAKLYNSNGQVEFIDKSGFTFKIPYISKPPSVPLLRVPSELLSEIVNIIDYINKKEKNILGFVDEILFDKGNYLFLCKSSRTKILLSRSNVFDCLANVPKMFDRIGASKILNANLIDLRFSDRIIVR